MPPQISIKISDVIATSLLAIEALYIIGNVHFYTNLELYEIYVSGRYRNFEMISKNDKMFEATGKIIDCNKAPVGRADIIEMTTSSIFSIGTSMFLEVAFKKPENGHCVDQIMFRTMPG